MAEEESKCPPCEEGLPAYMGTFADLMSLLMCFFVLLLSFSEMDVQKYKRVAGSMKAAFGVQREVRAKEIPKGTSIIAKQFSPGKPQVTAVPQMRQMTTNDIKNNLDFTDSDTKYNRSKGLDSGRTAEGNRGDGVNKGDLQIALGKSRGEQDSDGKGLGEGEGSIPERGGSEEKPSPASSFAQAQADAAAAREAKAEQMSRQLRKLLRAEIANDMIQVEHVDGKVTVTIKENGIFAAGRAQIRPEFLPVLLKISLAVKDLGQKAIIAGHSDNIPIKTALYSSNWSLSSARAASVIEFMSGRAKVDPSVLQLRAFADTNPISDNDTPNGRARNRRVEVILYEDAVVETIGEADNSVAPAEG
ncbi:MAG: OmpA family protein [Gammaproteobacteria bacterium]|nr:OmpA family protein [Gammaproteobacteria bacterium]